MLLAEKRKRQEVAGKVNHPEYVYRLHGDPREFEERRNVRPQGDMGPAQNYNRDRQGRPPPFAVDDEGGGNGRGYGNGSPSNVNGNHYPGIGNRNGPRSGAGSPPAEGGGGGGSSPASGAPLAGFSPSPYAGGGWGGAAPGGGGGVRYEPTLPPLPVPTGPVPGPLPAAYHPKPPLVFHDGGRGPLFYPPQPAYYGQPAIPQTSMPVQSIELSPMASPAQQRPVTSPAMMLPDIRGGGSGNERPQTAQGRRGIPGAGDLIFGGGGGGSGGNGLSEQEDKARERMAARQRAQELQEANARQMAEQQRRKDEEKAREAAEARAEEARLQREREARAKREQAEIDREAREKELKMMGPRAAHALLAQQEADRKQKEAAAQAKRDAREAARTQHGENANGAASTPTPPPPPPAAQPTVTSATHDLDRRDGLSALPSAPPPMRFTPQPHQEQQHQQQSSWLMPTALGLQPARFHLAPLPLQPYYPAAGGAAMPPAGISTNNNITSGAGISAMLPAPAYSYETERMRQELRQLSEQQRHIERMLAEGALMGAGRLPPPGLADGLNGGAGAGRGGTYLRAGATGGGGNYGGHHTGLGQEQEQHQQHQQQSCQCPPSLSSVQDGQPSVTGAGRTSPRTTDEGVAWKRTSAQLRGAAFDSNDIPPMRVRPPAGDASTTVGMTGLTYRNEVDTSKLGGGGAAAAAAAVAARLFSGPSTDMSFSPPLVGGGGATGSVSALNPPMPGWRGGASNSIAYDPLDLAMEPSKFIGPDAPVLNIKRHKDSQNHNIAPAPTAVPQGMMSTPPPASALMHSNKSSSSNSTAALTLPSAWPGVNREVSEGRSATAMEEARGPRVRTATAEPKPSSASPSTGNADKPGSDSEKRDRALANTSDDVEKAILAPVGEQERASLLRVVDSGTDSQSSTESSQFSEL